VRLNPWVDVCVGFGEVLFGYWVLFSGAVVDCVYVVGLCWYGDLVGKVFGGVVGWLGVLCVLVSSGRGLGGGLFAENVWLKEKGVVVAMSPRSLESKSQRPHHPNDSFTPFFDKNLHFFI